MAFPKISQYYSVNQDQMIEVDRFMIEELGINLFQMMENAGSTIARIVRTKYLVAGEERGVNIAAGPGGNGGGALVAGRRLAALGVPIHVCLGRAESEMSPVAGHQLNALRNSGNVSVSNTLSADAFVTIDGLIGYSLKGEPNGQSAELIAEINEHPAPVVSVDVPSGFSVAEQTLAAVHVNATDTATLAANKVGLDAAEVSGAVGNIYLCDIAVPSGILDEATGQTLGLNQFQSGDIVSIRS